MRNSTFLRFLLITGVILVAMPLASNAQKWENGRFSGSFETNSIYYVPDKDVRMNTTPDNRIGSNNFAKLEYNNGRLTVGVQFEYYGKALQGFNSELDGAKVMTKYAMWNDRKFSITVGDIFEQFGSGLVLRSWEDRDLGFNNSIMGARFTYNFNDYVNLKTLWGRPRMAMDYLDTDIYAADLSVSLSKLFGMHKSYLALEGSYVNRYEDRSAWVAANMSNNMSLWSGRVVYETDFGLSLRGEVAGKGRDVFITPASLADQKSGNVQLAEISYNGNGFGISLIGRRMEYMTSRLTDDPMNVAAMSGDLNVMNYLPALTRQHTYMLASLTPHQIEERGEQGGQLDVFYNVKKGSALGGRYGMKLHLNASAYFPIDRGKTSLGAEGDRYITYTDVSADIDKKWNRSFETTFLYSFQGYNPTHGAGSTLYKSHIFVLDMLYKFNRKTSLRAELQYLYSEDDYGDYGDDWWGALVELNLAPSWSFFVSDMYNWGYGEKWNDNGKMKNVKQHYYNGGVSYSKGRVRASISYGRHRAGYVCSGGVCRMVPAYTGANFTLSASF